MRGTLTPNPLSGRRIMPSEMSANEKAQKARSLVADQVNALAEIVDRAESTRDIATARERLRRWKDRTARLLEESVSRAEAKRLQQKRMGSIVMGNPLRNFVTETVIYRSFLQALDEQLEEHPREIIEAPAHADVRAREVKTPPSTESRTVFIIHGHDELNLLHLKELLRERWQLDPVVLSGEAGRGRTLIEKFEQEAQRAAFALALITPDDVISNRGSEYAQARPNTVFELGWFYARLGRTRVCILLKKGATMHSDLDGISRIEFSRRVNEVVAELERELIDAGVLAADKSI